MNTTGVLTGGISVNILGNNLNFLGAWIHKSDSENVNVARLLWWLTIKKINVDVLFFNEYFQLIIHTCQTWFFKYE